jgi:hypothetical protein
MSFGFKGLNPGPLTEQEKINHILMHVRNQDECKAIRSLLASHNQETT